MELGVPEAEPRRDPDNTILSGAIVAEFNALKSEVAGRSASQQFLVNLTLTIAGVVLGIAFSRQSSVPVALVIPIFAPSCAMLYFDHAAQIAVIGRYIAQRLHPRMVELTGDSLAFAWEADYRSYLNKRVSAVFHYGVPTFVLFVAGPIVVSIAIVGTVDQPAYWAAWSFGLALEAVSTYLWVLFVRGDMVKVEAQAG